MCMEYMGTPYQSVTHVLFSLAGGAIPEEPRFVEPIQNVTVAAGRDVKLSCVVDNLGTFKVSLTDLLVLPFFLSSLLPEQVSGRNTRDRFSKCSLTMM